MGFLDWFRMRRKKKTDEEEVLERTGKLQTEVEKRVEKEPKRKRKKEESV